eukprot:TRINITY_DN38185_c0_g1_i1.p1 TRINITY_DN38185_c0_g1~~TRINITY_DN38185_c0_g1_i1.p1  ORF type:complete len:392 (+),score=112.92 TRINITY_DN38185_c0_g1_i1:81-1256(+)
MRWGAAAGAAAAALGGWVACSALGPPPPEPRSASCRSAAQLAAAPPPAAAAASAAAPLRVSATPAPQPAPQAAAAAAPEPAPTAALTAAPPAAAPAWQSAAPQRWLPLLPASRREWFDTEPPNLDSEKMFTGCGRPRYNSGLYRRTKGREGDGGCHPEYEKLMSRRKKRHPQLLSLPSVRRELRAAGGAARRILIDLGGCTVGTFAMFLATYPALHELGFGATVWEPNQDFAHDWAQELQRRAAGSPGVGLSSLRYIPYGAWVENATLRFLGGGNSGKLDPTNGTAPAEDRRPQARKRKLREKLVPVMDFVTWLRANVRVEDFVVLKVDIEGSEHALIPHLIRQGAAGLIDEAYMECHCEETWNFGPWRWPECYHLLMSLMEAGVYTHEWF